MIGFATVNIAEGDTGMVCASGNPAGRTITLNYFATDASAGSVAPLNSLLPLAS